MEAETKTKDGIRVAVRVRPCNQREKAEECCVEIAEDRLKVTKRIEGSASTEKVHTEFDHYLSSFDGFTIDPNG